MSKYILFRKPFFLSSRILMLSKPTVIEIPSVMQMIRNGRMRRTLSLMVVMKQLERILKIRKPIFSIKEMIILITYLVSLQGT